jgi:hypothetical protein
VSELFGLKCAVLVERQGGECSIFLYVFPQEWTWPLVYHPFSNPNILCVMIPYVYPDPTQDVTCDSVRLWKILHTSLQVTANYEE